MSTTTASQSTQEMLTTALRAADPEAYAVAPRVLRRVLRSEFELRAVWQRAPHLHSLVISRDRLTPLVAADELHTDDLSHLAPVVVLVELPEESELESEPFPRLCRLLHRRLFHAKIHAEYQKLLADRRIEPSTIRRRIDELGQVEFDEASMVLHQEHRLRPEPSRLDVYVEFAAAWQELKRFEPHLLTVWFPSFHDGALVNAVIHQDIDADALFENSQVGEARDEDVPSEPPEIVIPARAAPQRGQLWRRMVSRRLSRSRVKAAKAAAARGNDVRAAILLRKATPYAAEADRPQIEESIASAVDRLAHRLQAALQFDADEEAFWRQVLSGLAENSTRGFWNSDARLLFDLQKVCLDHEREVSAVDLLGWLFSMGRRPIKRSLQNQREVLMSKHLQSAARRVSSVILPTSLRGKLSDLLDAAAASAEHQLRDRIRPLVHSSLLEVGLTPANIPERVSFLKIVEELVDGVVRHGYLTMADLRDAISRNNLKLNDLSGPMEFLRGDRLLRSDKRLSYSLDGVYRRGEIYLRWLQALSSAAFGTKTGRFLVQYLAIPFAGAYIILAGLSHLLAKPYEALFESHLHLSNTSSVLSLGVVILFLVHFDQIRATVGKGMKFAWRGVRGVLFDLPRWFVRLEAVRAFLRHPFVTLLRRWIVQPALLTGLAWLVMPIFGVSRRPGWLGTSPLFVAFWLILNSRAGRDIEEVVTERLEKTWHQIRVHVFVALFDLIMDTFKRILDFIEKLLYEVDEFLRFRSGESVVSLAAKGVLGVVWAVVTFVVRFCVTLLIEPQVNPIKHFPVVTVSHKLILPFAFVVGKPFEAFTDPITAKAIGTTIVTCIPGIFGFLVWEFRENWRLYAANRLPNLTPTLVGEHGETLPRLLQPGFHSGTVPKIHSKHRRAARSPRLERRRQGDIAFQQRVHHIEESIRRFIDREFITLLVEGQALHGMRPSIGRVEVGLNSLQIDLLRGDEPPARLQFLDQSGWLLAKLSEVGWIATLSGEEELRLEAALAGFYRLAGVDLVREQIDACFPDPHPPYDIADRGLVVWPGGDYEAEVVYPLHDGQTLRPRPRHLAESWGLPRLEAPQLIFRENPLPWEDWLRLWPETPLGEADFRWLPPTPILPE